MVLQRLINEHHLELTDSLVDGNNTVLKVSFLPSISRETVKGKFLLFSRVVCPIPGYDSGTQ